MPKLVIDWKPGEKVKLDQLGTRKVKRITDGDTPFVEMSIRLLSVDAPEVHYPGNTDPAKYDQKFVQLADWIDQGCAPIKSKLGNYLKPLLATGKAGSLHSEQGHRAAEEFDKMLNTRLNNKKRPVFLLAANEHFDQYGRLLAYMSPYYTKARLTTITPKQRATFNLQLVESGWAASFPIYPSLPKKEDFELLQDAGEAAYNKKKGVWKDDKSLLGYEYRMCVRLYQITEKIMAGENPPKTERDKWIERYCADIMTGKRYDPQKYYLVPPYNRLFIWPDDVKEATARLGLTPAKDNN